MSELPMLEADAKYVRRFVRWRKWGERFHLIRHKPCGCARWLWGTRFLWCADHCIESLGVPTRSPHTGASTDD